MRTFAIFDVPGASTTTPSGINDGGQVVGSTFSTDSLIPQPGQHGFLRDSDGNFFTIDVPGARGTGAGGINNAGQIVGGYVDSTGGHGFLDIGGSFTTVDAPGAVSTTATDINDAGQIVGFFFDNTLTHGFLATSISEVPEPSSLALLCAGIIGLGILRCHRAPRRCHPG